MNIHKNTKISEEEEDEKSRVINSDSIDNGNNDTYTKKDEIK